MPFVVSRYLARHRTARTGHDIIEHATGEGKAVASQHDVSVYRGCFIDARVSAGVVAPRAGGWNAYFIAVAARSQPPSGTVRSVHRPSQSPNAMESFSHRCRRTFRRRQSCDRHRHRIERFVTAARRITILPRDVEPRIHHCSSAAGPPIVAKLRAAAGGARSALAISRWSAGSPACAFGNVDPANTCRGSAP